jgi:hypothetical protein
MGDGCWLAMGVVAAVAAVGLVRRGSAAELRYRDDPDWKARFGPKVKARLDAMPELRPLRDRLLSFGGDEVALTLEEDLEKILERGTLLRTWEDTAYSEMPGEPGQCHRNTAALWEANPDRIAIWTGWALSEDGMWRQHSWGWDIEEGAIVETTEDRVMYYGFELTKREARKFYKENSPW